MFEFLIGLFLGSFIGVATLSLVIAGGDDR